MKKKLPLLLVVMLAALLLLCSCGEKEKTITGISVPVPDGFVKSDETGMEMWMAPDYPNDGSNVVCMVEDKDDISFGVMNSELVKKQVEDMYAQTYGVEVTVNVTTFERTELDGEEAVRMILETEINGVGIKQIQYIINADKLYSVGYTEMGGTDWFSDFEKCASEITFERA